MSRIAIMLMLGSSLAASPALAQAAGAVDCRALAEAAEREAGLPPGLLVAIGQVETGRPNPATGRVEPWPWSTNLGGAGHYFATAGEAIGWTAMQQALGQRSIDVGCFQVNLKYHPDAFATLEEAFDPANNARYAAAFLTELHRRTGSWQLAAAQYHSADPQQGEPYGNRVFALMGGHGALSDPGAPVVAGSRVGTVAVRLPLLAFGVRVIVPSWAAAASAPGLVRQVAYQRQSGSEFRSAPIRMTSAMPIDRRLPRVYTPS